MTSPIAPVPVGVLTGFLGAGKTTLLNRVLAAPGFAGSAVVVNEFGEIGIDHLLVEAVAGDMLVLTNGCICCAARGDLLAAVDGLLERRPRLGFDRILIETTGLADPGPILNAILLGPGLAGGVRLGGVVTLVSAVDGHLTLDRHDEARRQVVLADRVLVTKADLAPERVAALEARIAALNPAATVADARAAALDTALFEAGPAASPAPARPPLDHGHHHHAADARIRSAVLEAGIVDADRLGAFVATLQERWGPALLRLKGIAALRHDPSRPTVLQAVGHLLHPATRLERWPDPQHRTRLVVILDGVDPAAVTALWEGFFGGPAVDAPDAAALTGEGGKGLFA